MGIVSVLSHVVQALCVLNLVSASLGGPPYFTAEPRDTIVYKTNLVLHCAAQGDPAPTIRWYRGNPPILVPDDNVMINGSLVIPTVVEGVDASRGGIPYHCRATSTAYGTLRSREANVYHAFFDGFQDSGEITYAVNIPDVPADRDTVALYCNVSESNPPPAIVWVDNFNQTVPNDNTKFIYFDGGKYLVILNIEPATALKVFHCRVTNALGVMVVDSQTHYRFNITAAAQNGLVMYKPFQNVVACEGDTNVQFLLVATSSEPVTLDYTIIYKPPGSQQTIIKQNSVMGILPGPVTTRDNGTVVRCKVFASLGTLTYFATLTVLARVNLTMISSPGDSWGNLVGTDITFTCEAVGVNLVTRWYRNGEEVSPGPHVVTTTFNMTIYGMVERDSGLYQCSVSNGTSSIWRQWRVEVRLPRLVPMPTTLSVVVVDGGNTTLTVQVMSYPPPNCIQWYMNGSVVRPGPLYLISDITVANASTDPIVYEGSLTITSVNLTTLGSYWASFCGYVGVVNTSAIFVTPPVPPHVLGLHVPSCLRAGGGVQLVCEVYGYPIPVVHFIKDNSTLSGDGHVVTSGNTLTISNVQPSDEGVYSCLAQSEEDVDHSIYYELFYCSVQESVSNSSYATNSSALLWSVSITVISVVVVSVVVAVAASMATVVIVMIWCYHRLNSKHCSVDISEQYTHPYNLSQHESNVEFMSQQSVVDAPIGLYETVYPHPKKPCVKIEDPNNISQQCPPEHTTVLNVTYSLPDLSKKRGQDPSTIVHVQAPMGDIYTVSSKTKISLSNGHECQENNRSMTETSSSITSAPMNHHTIAPHTGEVYMIQTSDYL